MNNDEKLESEVRLSRFRRNLFRWLCGIGFIVLIGWGTSPFVKLGFNATNSVDGYVFLIVKGVIPQKGELVAFWPPENDFYENVWFVKYLKGVPGDSVVRQGQLFYIDGEYLGAAKTQSKGGIPLEPSKAGVIPDNSYFVWTPHADSFDSRYEQIGLVSEDRFIGRAYRIF